MALLNSTKNIKIETNNMKAAVESKTPLVWCVKWAATIMILISVSFRNAGVEYYLLDMIFGTIGTILWLWVSIVWKDRALIMLNVVMFVLLFSGVLKQIA
jgi:ABC-type siderophore export system fused ATPase/permease subunit